MTEPREQEPVPEGESVHPDPTAVPDTGNWHPVAAPEPEPPTEPEAASPEPLVEPVETTAAPESLAEPDEARAAPEPRVEPVETEPEPLAEPDEAPAAQEPLVEPVETTAAPVSLAEPDEAPEPIETPVPAPDDTSETVQLRTSPPETEPTVALEEGATLAQTTPLVIPDEPVPPRTEPTESIFRTPSPMPSPEPEPTRLEPVSEEEQKLAAERAARREARAAALAAAAPMPVVAPAPVVVHKRTNDKFWGSLGLFLLRIVLAGIFTIRGLNILTDVPAAEAQFAKTILANYPPGTQVMAIATGVASLLIALSLLLGLLTRVAGLGIALIAGGALALVYWGPWSPFVAGQPGFLGEYELLLAAVGLLLLCIGGGGWSLDRSFRAGRERDKAERAAEAA